MGLSEHLGVDISVSTKGFNSKCHLTASSTEYMENLEFNSIFRMVSTGVDEQSGITPNTSVQIQHVQSKRFLQADQKFKLENKNLEEGEEDPNQNPDEMLLEANN